MAKKTVKPAKQKEAISFLQKVKNEIEKQGIKQLFLAEKVEMNYVHLNRVLNNKITLTDDVRDKLKNYFWPPVKKK